MGEIYRADDLNGALKLAKEFKAMGKYDLFRGQGQNWRVVSTAGRLNQKQFNGVKKRLERLYNFFDSTPTLNKFHKNIDWFYAVAQHYGIPTNYIDFTISPEIAAFFATNSKSNKIGKDCVLVCLSESDFNRFIQVTKSIYINDKVLAPFIAKIDVDNLWRLQAQKGCFLYSPYADIEFYYDFDRILFPFSDSFNGVSIKDVYPDRKSELEILLDQFFNSEGRLEGSERLRQLVKETKTLHYTLPPLNFKDLLKAETIHPSWQSREYDRWNYLVKEEWSKPETIYTVKLSFSKKRALDAQIEFSVNELNAYFAIHDINRSCQIEFEITSTPKFTKKLARNICQSCMRIWDGMRNLPYTNNEIFTIISKYMCLEVYDSMFDDTLSLSGEDLIVLEMTNDYGSITRCYASPSKVVAAFRADIKEVLIEELAKELNSEILLRINQPNLLFDFVKLIELFKDELLPYQILYNSEKTNPVIYYSPAQIAVLGYA